MRERRQGWERSLGRICGSIIVIAITGAIVAGTIALIDFLFD